MVVRPSRGGAFGHVVRLSSELASRGHDVAICGPHSEHRGGTDVPIIELPISRAPSALGDTLALVGLGRIYRSYRPDLIHAHGSKGGVLARLARVFLPGVPLVFTAHNFAFTNHVSSKLKRSAYRVLEQAMAPLATRVICVCEAELEIAARLGLRSRARVVHNGIVPLRNGTRNAAVADLGKLGPVLAAVTELQTPKGVISLVEAMPKILERVPTANAVIAGEGVERDAITARIASLGVARKVHLLGQVDDVAGLLACADVFVQPSWSESFPYAVLEAMSLGLPIVATDVGGVGEAIEDRSTGRLVAPRDPVALACAVDWMLSDRPRAISLGRAARTRMATSFGFDAMVDGTLAVYAELGIE